MLLKALDLLRTLGWYIVHFIYDLIDSLFDILRGLNSFDIINRELINPNAKKISRSTKERKNFYNAVDTVYQQVNDFLNLKEIDYDGKTLSILDYLNAKSEENGYNFVWT